MIKSQKLPCAGLLLLVLSGALAQAPAQAASDAAPSESEQLSVIANGEVVGSVKVEHQGRHVSIDYQVVDNGRGPKHHDELDLDARGMPLNWTIQGQSLMGSPVSERYHWADGKAQWQSQADAGDVAVSRPPLYIANDGNPWYTGLYARAVLASGQSTLAVLPAGHLQLTRLREVTLGQGDQKLGLTVYRLQGIDLAPEYLMLDDQQRLFADFTSRDVTLRSGYEGEAQHVLQLGGELDRERARALQQQLAHRDPAPLRVINVHIFDPANGTRGALASVLVRDGHISAIDAADKTRPGEQVYDGQGGTLIPGLHDMHSHTRLDSGLWYLAAGVTSTRDMGNDNSFLLDLIPRIDSGELAGPRIVRNGFLEGRSPYSEHTGFIVDSQEEALEKVRWYKAHGYWQIKIYNSMNPAWVPAIAAEAHRLGMRVTGHVPAFATADEMIGDGYDEITHVNQLMLGWLLKPGEDTRTPLRLTAMARAADLDLDSPKVQHTLALMREHHTPLDPTEVILERLMLSRSGEVQAGDAPYLSHMPIGYQRYRKRTFVPNLTPELDQQYRAAFDKTLQLLGRLHAQGTQLLPGTDDTTGFTVHRELELYVKAGMTPAEALRADTLDCERYFGRDAELGSIAVGKRADFVLLRDNPVEDISAVRTARMVVKDDEMYFPADIYAALGVAPFVPVPPRLH